jgi:catechol 2,3-dioxygenase-like lactoylglutathione lyase family enzyme
LIGATQVQHVGVSVANLERSLAFYKEILDIEPEFVTDGSGPDVSRAVGVPEALLSFAFLRLGPTILELLEYKNPRGKPYDRRNCDIGAVHIALEVPNIDAAYERLLAHGVEFNSPPLRINEGPLTGSAFAYFPDPDGVQLEIFEVGQPTSSTDQ